MDSYVRFGDVVGVITAGGQWTSAAETFDSTMRDRVAAIRSVEPGLKATDDYGRAFDLVHRRPVDGGPWNERLLKAAEDVTAPARELGLKVVQAATAMLYQDAVSAAAIARSTEPAGER